MLNWEGVGDTSEDRGLAEKQRGRGADLGGQPAGTVPRAARTPSTSFVLGWGEGAGVGSAGVGRVVERGAVARQHGDTVERT